MTPQVCIKHMIFCVRLIDDTEDKSVRSLLDWAEKWVHLSDLKKILTLAGVKPVELSLMPNSLLLNMVCE